MKYSMETYTQLTNDLQDFNQEIRRRHSSMHLYTEQEMKRLEPWLEETKQMAKNLETLSSIIYHHLELLSLRYQEQQQEGISRD